MWRFVSSVLPGGNEDLKGNKVDTIIKFKNALGSDDPDAANMHKERARRIFHQRLEETGDCDAEIGQGRVEVAVRDSAQRLYAQKLKSIDRDLDLKQLAELREAQLSYHLSDELAEEMFKDHTKKLVEECLSKAINILKSRNRSGGNKEVMEELNKVIAFHDLLVSLKNHPDAANLARGVGLVSLVGGDYDSDNRFDDLKLLYRAYATDSLSTGQTEESKVMITSVNKFYGSTDLSMVFKVKSEVERS